MRSRGENGTSVYTAETMAERFGVNKGSYETVAIPKAQLYKAWLSSLENLSSKASGPLSSYSFGTRSFVMHLLDTLIESQTVQDHNRGDPETAPWPSYLVKSSQSSSTLRLTQQSHRKSAE